MVVGWKTRSLVAHSWLSVHDTEWVGDRAANAAEPPQIYSQRRMNTGVGANLLALGGVSAL
jgi:hypothetical protein